VCDPLVERGIPDWGRIIVRQNDYFKMMLEWATGKNLFIHRGGGTLGGCSVGLIRSRGDHCWAQKIRLSWALQAD
jgi:hypothetical protein